ncbi:hypothetical protein I545_2241 [Mycobacterium kansasii 662]|uniref:Uncharacterized protein n=2 Tax=Mycobacterium kansasii TaxID=1768 RepID=U5WYQ4_MYCKA|nr:hypothetical protein [Mycobacterium kansasii]AGZ54047.1 hypothetical protein MKAN_05900 [Mycobacterium kansasii ATCC 12478]EUA20086.1 hypothetical protein I545_2241 [Mycobacterium kansasii 662]KEP40241.1 hypothetical protein MKSMC1_46610 [Mycobacterium kansasii]
MGALLAGLQGCPGRADRRGFGHPTTAAAGDPPATAGGNGTMIAAATARNAAP